jgi:electron transport complex protein RnfE
LGEDLLFSKEFFKGLWRENPVFVLVLGMCPILAITTSVKNSIGMGCAVIFVLLCSNIVVSLIRSFIPDKVRIPAYIVIIASFVTIVDLVISGYFRGLYHALGIFIPLIVVNCIILGRAEAFASRNSVFSSIADALGIGIGYTIALILIGGIREILGNGTLFDYPLFWKGFEPALVMILPPGAFLTLGFLIGVFKVFEKRR